MEPELEFIKLLAGLIQAEMDLTTEVVIYNQAFPIPPTKELFCAVSMLADKPFGVTQSHRDDPDAGLVEEQMVNVQEAYQILLYSFTGEARRRRHEIPMLLLGDRAQQSQEKYAYKIGYIPTSFVDVSETEGTSRLNRYALTIRILCAYSRTRRVEYYDQFFKPPFLLITNP